MKININIYLFHFLFNLVEEPLKSRNYLKIIEAFSMSFFNHV